MASSSHSLFTTMVHSAGTQQTPSESYYTILGVNSNATLSEIKAAFRRISLTTHPDKTGDLTAYQNIVEAYGTLSDPEKRKHMMHRWLQKEKTVPILQVLPALQVLQVLLIQQIRLFEKYLSLIFVKRNNSERVDVDYK